MSATEGDSGRGLGEALAALAALRSGPPLLGAAALALGVIGLWRADFTIVWHPMPDYLPARTMLALFAAGVFVVSGTAVLLKRASVAAGVALAILFLFLSQGWLNRVIQFPGIIGTWLGLAEQVALAIGALAIAAAAGGWRSSIAVFCRIGFGICQIVFALGHFLSLKETVAMAPAYIPPGPEFWAWATGVGHLAGGVALLAGFQVLYATRLLALMFLSFGLLVWLPQLVSDPASPVAQAGNAINLALVGAVLAVGSLASRPRREL